MGFKDYFKNKKTKNEPDITETLTNTIEKLQIYLENLNNGKIHDIKKYEGSKKGKCAKLLIQDEKINIIKTIEQLKDAKQTITRGRIAEKIFHYDLDGRCMSEEE